MAIGNEYVASIRCISRKQARNLFVMMHELDVRWAGGDPVSPNNYKWNCYKSNTVYTLDGYGRLYYGNIIFGTRLTRITEFKKLIKTIKE